MLTSIGPSLELSWLDARLVEGGAGRGKPCEGGVGC